MENNNLQIPTNSAVVHSIEGYAFSAFGLAPKAETKEAKTGEGEKDKLLYFEWGKDNNGLTAERESLFKNGKAYSTIYDSVSIAIGNRIEATNENGEIVVDEAVIDFLDEYREQGRNFLLDYAINGFGAFFCRVNGKGEITEIVHRQSHRIRLCKKDESREMEDIDTLLYSDFWEAPVFSGDKKNVFDYPVYQKPKKAYDFPNTADYPEYIKARKQRYSNGFFVVAGDYTPSFFPYYPPKWLGALVHIEIANLLADYFKSMLTKGLHGDYILSISDSFRDTQRHKLNQQSTPQLSQPEIEAQLEAWEKDFSTKIRASLSGAENKGTGISFFVPSQELEGAAAPVKIIRIEHNPIDEKTLKVMAASNLEISSAIGMPAGITNNPTKDTFSPTGGSGSEVRTSLTFAQEILLSDYQEKLLKPLKRLMKEMNGWKYTYKIEHTNIVALNKDKSGIVDEGKGGIAE